MNTQLLAVTVIGFVAGLTVLIMAFRSTRTKATHPVLWVLALVLLGISIAFRLFLTVGLIINASALDVATVAIGNLAVIAVFVTALRQPTWAGLALIASAVVMPLLTWLLSLIGSVPGPADIAAPMLGFYSLPAIVTGTLLTLSAHQWKSRGMRSTPPVGGTA